MKSAIIPHIDHANDVGPDQTSVKATSAPDPHCLSYIQQYPRHTSKLYNGLFQISAQLW